MSENSVAPAPGRWTDLGVRTGSAAVLIPAVLLDIWLGGRWFELFMALLGLLMAYEWTNIVHARSSSQFALHCAAVLCAAFMPPEIGVLATFGLIAGLAAIGILANSFSTREKNIFAFSGVFYVSLPVLALVLLRSHSQWGVHAIMWLMLVVWSTDSFAYFAGRIFGGPKLAPKLSPKKTWSGLLGGMVGAAAISTIYAAFQLPGWMGLAVVAAALAVIAQIGDIFESALKRHFGVKDSGRLIPGHGGVLDRVDGLVAAGVAAALIGYVRHSNSLAEGLLLW
jgi:phosphatidate cytidylyltransferase